MMRVLAVHNYYQQAGGEDCVFESECRLLEDFGNEVLRYSVHNNQITNSGKWALAKNTIWNHESSSAIHRLVRDERVDLVHFHNTFPLISPASFRAAHRAGAAVVCTIHNFRFVCPKAVLYRDGKVCNACLGKRFAWPALQHNCYRDSKMATTVVAANATVHRIAKTFPRFVDACITPTNFVREHLRTSGYPLGRVFTKPHFVDFDRGMGDGLGHYAVFVGRLSEEKGLDVLLDAWAQLSSPIELRIIGDGPLACRLRDLPKNIRWLGALPQDAVYNQMANAACLICPSTCYESFGRVVIEAYAQGTPVITANHGGQAEVATVGDGLQFQPGCPSSLASVTEYFFSNLANADVAASEPSLRQQARAEYLAKYTAETNYEQLHEIYREALRHRGKSPPEPASPEPASPEPASPESNETEHELGRRTSSRPANCRTTQQA